MCIFIFWAPPGYLQHRELCWPAVFALLLLLFVWTHFPTHLTCARPNTLLMLMTDGRWMVDGDAVRTRDSYAT